jgi:hypothetical protein
LVEETGVPGENQCPVASHLQTLSHNGVSSTPNLRTCMLHSSTIFPGTSPYTVTTGGGRSTYSKTRKGNCGLRFNDQDLFLLFRLF